MRNLALALALSLLWVGCGRLGFSSASGDTSPEADAVAATDPGSEDGKADAPDLGDLAPGDSGHQDLGPADGDTSDAAETADTTLPCPPGAPHRDPATGACVQCVAAQDCSGALEVCTRWACTGGSCRVEDNDLAECEDGDPCTRDLCLAGACRGVAWECDDGDVCTDDSCAGGGCVHAPKACSAPHACATSQCVPKAGGCVATPITCPRLGTSSCSVTFCDATQGCVTTEVGCECTLDTDCQHLLTGPDAISGGCVDISCQGGMCVKGAVPDGPMITCSDGNPCTFGDTCVGGTCVGTTKVCPEPDNPCHLSQCVGGLCALVAEDCDDHDPCTVDACLPNVTEGASCSHAATSCDDGVACTKDSCQPLVGCRHDASACECSSDDTCPSVEGACLINRCTEDNRCELRLLTGNACGDGVGCHAETCAQGACVAATACDDGNPCTFDVCDEDGECQFPTKALGGAMPCDDGNRCTVDTCDPVTGCEHAPKGCDDDDVCTIDFCLPTSGCVSFQQPSCKPCAAAEDCPAPPQCQAAACVQGPGGSFCNYGATPGAPCGNAGTCTAAGTCEDM